jgi:hypothetical protein
VSFAVVALVPSNNPPVSAFCEQMIAEAFIMTSKPLLRCFTKTFFLAMLPVGSYFGGKRFYSI